MTDLKPYKLALHELFAEVPGDPTELMSVVERFLAGDCGDLSDEDEVLGFMRRSLSGDARHAVYETATYGRVHVLAKNPEILVLPDLVYASEYVSVGSEINTCTCPACVGTTEPTPTHENNS